MGGELGRPAAGLAWPLWHSCPSLAPPDAILPPPPSLSPLRAGRDALGMGSSIAHPRESDEWKGMSLDQKFEFFAPIWRVMVSQRSSCLALRCC